MRLIERLAFRFLLLILAVSVLGFLKVFTAYSSSGWEVDVFTQKETFSGVGLGVPSDAFAPHEEVVLFAYVSYNLAPVQNILVSFEVFGPRNPLHNVTFSFVDETDDDGVARTNFTIPWPDEKPETVVFGYWSVVASIENASDHLVFRVGWIVEIASLSVIDEDPPQGGYLNVQVSVMTNAMMPKNATLAFVLFDCERRVIGSFVEELSVDSNGVNFSRRFSIPKWAAVGLGTVNASIYFSTGAPYGPGCSTTFVISLMGDLDGDNKVDIKDVALVIAAFGSYPGHCRWNPRADSNKDYVVNVKDVALVSKNYGKTYP
ncbi:hypothetical protein DRO69_07500 [Candidatus Bathyarchaeota archaeon]|nr:MAG: hypothetical protein DRO69_07500 [Candidatus Bathyarchaeota archaeon]